MKRIFIDGGAGTTGLRIDERLDSRDDISLIRLSEENRKNPAARREALNAADVVFLCLPDEAARESVAMCENPDTVIIDASTAHRTSPGWAYGFPELSAEHEQKIRQSKRIAVPGCHASGFISLVYPLVEAGLLPADAALTCFSLSGYSGAGKKAIALYEDAGRDPLLNAPRQYALKQSHKHLPEMTAVCGLAHSPVFSPVIDAYYSGMEVTVPLFVSQLAAGGTARDIERIYTAKYNGPVVRCTVGEDEDGFLSAGRLSGSDSMLVSVYGNDERITLVSRFDNLGKGASGAAVECLNLVLGEKPEKCLSL